MVVPGLNKANYLLLLRQHDLREWVPIAVGEPVVRVDDRGATVLWINRHFEQVSQIVCTVWTANTVFAMKRRSALCNPIRALSTTTK